MAENHNQIEPDYAVSPEAEAEMTEGQIRDAVMRALDGANDINTAAIEITVEAHGKVRLTGQVDDQYEKDLAEGITRNVPGVHGVENHLIVMAPTPQTELPSRTANRPSVQ